MTKCSTCDAPIRWAIFAASGKRVPLDFEPSPRGNLVVTGQANDGTPFIAIASADGPTLYINHFATCPQAAQHRRKK